MSASDSDGIRTLLEAETIAQKQVQEARQFRAERLKAAKADAKSEIEKYKEQKEKEFQAYISQFNSNESGESEASNKAAAVEIEALQSQSQKGRPEVLKLLIDKAIST